MIPPLPREPCVRTSLPCGAPLCVWPCLCVWLCLCVCVCLSVVCAREPCVPLFLPVWCVCVCPYGVFTTVCVPWCVCVQVFVTPTPLGGGFGCTFLITFLTNVGDLPLLEVGSGDPGATVTALESLTTGGTLTPSSATGRAVPIRNGNSTALGGDFTVSFRGQVGCADSRCRV